MTKISIPVIRLPFLRDDLEGGGWSLYDIQSVKSKVGNILAKATALRINLNIDGAPIASRAHTHPSHSQTSRLLFTSLSLGIPFPRL
jgi:hypothetical protein